ncbi:hypothetical protein [Catenulispora subtropica]|uniref:Uncharacterized protein n=1 Tax=Catenulispora subtropica TaxID=450798 RepID=A0ABN2RK99_9ACTN
MAEQPRTPVIMQLDAGIPPGEENELREALAAAGFDLLAQDLPKVRGMENLDAVALLMIPLHAFLTTAGEHLAADAYPRFKNAVRRLLHRPAKDETRPAPLIVQDTATGLKVVMERDLPDEAYEALRTLDLTAFRTGPVDWDRGRGRWRSLTDEVNLSAPSPARP